MIRELLLSAGPAALAWAAAIYRLPVLWRPAESHGLRAHWFAHITLAIALSFLVVPVYLAFDAFVGIPNLARLLGHASVLISAWCVQVYFAYLALPRDRAHATSARSGAVLVCAIVLMALFFHLANIGQDGFDYAADFASAPFVLEYTLAFLAYLAWSMVMLITLAWRYAPLARARPALFLGLHLLALAGWGALAYVVYEGAWAATRRLSLQFPIPDPELPKEVLIAISIGLLLVGATLPAWGPRVGVPALYNWTTRYLACRRLYLLWRDLCAALPELALVRPTSRLADMLAVQSVDLQLTRRVVEIRDGRLALRTSIPAGVTEAARQQCRDAGLASGAEQLIVEAACVAAALDARRLGSHLIALDDMPATIGAADLDTEVAHLVRLAEAYRSSPIVKAIRASVRPPQVAPSESALA